jgi:protein SCO1/2
LSKRGYKTVQEAKSRARSGVCYSLPFAPHPIIQDQPSNPAERLTTHQPFSWQAGLLFLAAGAGLTFYFRYEKARMARARVAAENKGIGKPLVGGAFHLTDHNGKDFSAEDLKGKYSLVYFGFTHCPDICPEELDKMAGMIDAVKEKHGEGVMRNVFISCDPARDTPEVIRRYLAEFHEDILGMTGTWQEVKDVCKAYRVYFSTPADVQPGQDYLVDHSIYFYLMGEFWQILFWGRTFY